MTQSQTQPTAGAGHPSARHPGTILRAAGVTCRTAFLRSQRPEFGPPRRPDGAAGLAGPVAARHLDRTVRWPHRPPQRPGACPMSPTRAPDADHACDAAPDLLGLDAALAQGVGLAAPVPDIETLPLGESIGRVLAEAVTSPHPLPPFDTAAMDGYALASADLGAEGPWRLPVAGRVPAGAREARPGPRARSCAS